MQNINKKKIISLHTSVLVSKIQLVNLFVSFGMVQMVCDDQILSIV